MTLPPASRNSTVVGELVPLGGEFEPRQLGRTDGFGLNDFQIFQLEQKAADFRKVRGIITPLHHAPEIILLRERQFIRAVLDGICATSFTAKSPSSFCPMVGRRRPRMRIGCATVPVPTRRGPAPTPAG